MVNYLWVVLVGSLFMTSLADRCRQDETTAIVLQEIKYPATVIRDYENVTSAQECYDLCCDARGLGCNVASFFQSGSSRMCLTLQCVPFGNCVWGPFQNAKVAVLAEVISISPGKGKGPAGRPSVTPRGFTPTTLPTEGTPFSMTSQGPQNEGDQTTVLPEDLMSTEQAQESTVSPQLESADNFTDWNNATGNLTSDGGFLNGTTSDNETLSLQNATDLGLSDIFDEEEMPTTTQSGISESTSFADSSTTPEVVDTTTITSDPVGDAIISKWRQWKFRNPNIAHMADQTSSSTSTPELDRMETSRATATAATTPVYEEEDKKQDNISSGQSEIPQSKDSIDKLWQTFEEPSEDDTGSDDDWQDWMEKRANQIPPAMIVGTVAAVVLVVILLAFAFRQLKIIRGRRAQYSPLRDNFYEPDHRVVSGYHDE